MGIHYNISVTLNLQTYSTKDDGWSTVFFEFGDLTYAKNMSVLPLLQELRALEGQSVTLRCKARGDPDPIIHWIAPDGRLMSNSSRAAVHTDGTLDILISTVKDSGLFTPQWLCLCC